MSKSIHTKEYAYSVEHLQKARQEAGLTQVQGRQEIKASAVVHIEHRNWATAGRCCGVAEVCQNVRQGHQLLF